MATTFIEAPRFPTDISYGSRGGPAWRTKVVEVDSGAEVRNQQWSYPRHEYDVAYGIKEKYLLEDLISFFHVVAGRAVGFRYKASPISKAASIPLEPLTQAIAF